MPMPTRQGQNKPKKNPQKQCPTLPQLTLDIHGYSACFLQQLIQLLALENRCLGLFFATFFMEFILTHFIPFYGYQTTPAASNLMATCTSLALFLKIVVIFWPQGSPRVPLGPLKMIYGHHGESMVTMVTCLSANIRDVHSKSGFNNPTKRRFPNIV